PVAYAGGGIQEIIEDYDPMLDRGYGFLCYDYSSEAFWDSIKRALEVFRDRDTWIELIRRAMARQFSWSAAAQGYEELYGDPVGEMGVSPVYQSQQRIGRRDAYCPHSRDGCATEDRTSICPSQPQC